MIKKVSTSTLRVGMFIHNLDCKWMEHPFLANQFLLKDSKAIQRIASAGIRHVYIDTNRGKDVEHAPTALEVDRTLQDEIKRAAEGPNQKARVPVVRELGRAKKLMREATTVIRNLMEDARLGRQIQLATVNPIAERIIHSAFRSPHAITGISRIKSKDEYTFRHCVSITPERAKLIETS